MGRIETALTQRLAAEQLVRQGGRADQVAVEHLFEDAQRAQDLRPVDGRVRLPRGGGFGDELLHGAGCGAHAVQAGGSPVQGFHRHSQGERLPVAAYGAAGAVRRADRGADPHRRDGLGGRARRGRALGLQDRLRARPTARRRARASGCPRWPTARPIRRRRASSSRTSRSTCFRTRSICSLRAATFSRCRAMRRRSISPMPCIRTWAITRWPPAWTRSWCRCVRGWNRGSWWRSSPRPRPCRIRPGWSRW